MESVFFSIILPTYNRADFLHGAIQSVIEQSFTNWELVIIDDGSTDNTKIVGNDFARKDSRIKYYYQSNKERSAARNHGIKKARGEYICFLDSDDEYKINHLEVFKQAIDLQKKNAIYISGAVIHTPKSIIELSSQNFISNYPSFFFKSSIVPGRLCIKSSVFNTFLFDPEIRISEDTDLLVRISSKYSNIYFTNINTFIYKKHSDNSVNYEKYNAYLDRKKTLIKILEKSKKMNFIINDSRKVINDCSFGIFKHYYSNKLYLKAFITIIKSIFEYPIYRFKEKIYILLLPHKWHKTIIN